MPSVMQSRRELMLEAAPVQRLEGGVAALDEIGNEAGQELELEQDQLAERNGQELETLEQQLETETDWDNDLDKPNEFLRFFLRMGFGAVMHPYEYAKVLMQLGYEPLPAVASTSWLGRSTLFLPSVHQYIRYIRHTDGFAGLYRGLGPRILSSASSALLSESLVHLVGWRQLEKPAHPLREYVSNTPRDGIIIATGLAISHPFYVISVRQMAQFVGREVVYSTIRGSVREILAQDGPLGFYAGFLPRLISDLGVLFCTSTLSAICNRVFMLKSDQREYNSALLQFGAIMLLYPLQVVGACMACSGSGVAAGAPPFMPIYCQWIDCLTDLIARGDHYRGAFIFRRTLPKMQAQRIYDPYGVSRMI
ncbi:mitochondrial carrier homolog 2 [Drosophila montana]|uniref:mitochondrial carrier homolog 2 n=1 Tax=Drosophila montana TaxID=40370 RepID=UPI00313EBEC9